MVTLNFSTRDTFYHMQIDRTNKLIWSSGNTLLTKLLLVVFDEHFFALAIIHNINMV